MVIMMKGVKDRSIDPASQEMLASASRAGLETAWDRFDKQQPQCGFGELGLCCRHCNMGPCRIDPFGEGPARGVCGADADVMAARGLLRALAAGAAAHSDHARDVALTFQMMADGRAPSYQVKDKAKMKRLAAEYGIAGDSPTMMQDLAKSVLSEFGQQQGTICFTRRAPAKRVAIWQRLGIDPRGIDREIVECLHRSHMGVDADYVNLILHGLRTALADGWGGSMIATELQDVMFGVPTPIRSRANLGVLQADSVNVIVHGHEPLLSEMIVAAAADPELIALAKSKGAAGINVAGICCTGNEVLMRHGVPVAGNFLQQELAIATGAVEAMVVDVQCVMPALQSVASCFHTKLITTSPKAKVPGATHMEFHEESALDTAREIVRAAVENYPQRNRDRVQIPDFSSEVMIGFSVEAILSALGGSLDPLLGAIKNGSVRGIAAVVGCNNPKVKQDFGHVNLVKELIKNDVLVVSTGCSAQACAKAGLLLPEAAGMAGEGLRGVCQALGIPPVLHMGSCVDISRILVACAAIANALGVDISDLPAAAAAPEWMSEKAVSIGAYAVASGVLTVLGTVPQVLGSANVTALLTKGAAGVVGGRFAVEPDPFSAARVMIDHIDRQRARLGI
ncbi:MAG TPA: anaerobic carbon-monoxide dehydrogenase catalytic subunit [Methanotrichaceae archaeon]|nr:anaerobic carbon-monoxide dehydrogenase catalytic subunit [Methanotrichaceae archaeon]HQF16829.1 anaerobic carbon-monoxide dehydrogenase catalytic subunit [Methanotrichaceae archaeon]HQI90155.1 anaerobic carbon-monoxide dehydrogenase catalytic subunit [Methanotrichaceae archaeon]HQJ29123.1 anaerobic carbon-monoxide dehydrogenase catalytic subunit [Methanotrichaceae archaeon]